MSNEEYVKRFIQYIIACEVKLTGNTKGIKEVLALNLKKNRLKLGLTQEKLSEKANISTHYFAMVELAKKFPSASMLERLATALEIDPNELFYMPSTSEKALMELKETIATDIEQIIKETLEKVLTSKYKEKE